jgi:hypothetical protein
MMGLGFLDPTSADRRSVALDISADGAVVVGHSMNADGFFEAFRWTSSSAGLQSVADWLGPDVDLTGIRLEAAHAVSSDGSAVAGYMTRDGFTEAYLARVGGLISPDDIASSLASVAVPTAGAGVVIGESTRNGVDCADFGPAGICAFAQLRYDFDPVLAGSAGASFLLGEQARIGFSAGYSHQLTDLPFDGTAESVGPLFSIFSGLGVHEGSGPQLFAALTYGHFHTEIDRGYVNGAGTTTSHGKTSVVGAGAYSRLGWGMPIGTAAMLTPFADLSGTWTRQSAYTETTGPFPASLDERAETSLFTRLGLDIGLAVTPNLHLLASMAWAHQLIDNADPVSGHLVGLFDATTAAPARADDWVEGSVGTEVGFGEGSTAHARLTAKSGAIGDFTYSAEGGFRQAF